MGANQIAAGRAFLQLLVDNKEFAKGLDEGLQKLQGFAQKATKIGADLGKLGGVLSAPFAAGIAAFATVGDELEKMSKRTGIGVKALSEFRYAAEQSGSSLEDFEGTLRKMQRSIGEATGGSKEAASKFTALGLSVAELQRLSPDEQFSRVAAAIGAIEDPTQRAADAMAIFGKSGTSVLPMVENLAQLRQEANELGLTLDEGAGKSAERLHDAFNRLKLQTEAVAIAIGQSLAPAVSKIVETLAAPIKAVIDFIHQNQVLVSTAGQVAGALTAVSGVIFAFDKYIKFVISQLTKLGEVLVAVFASPEVGILIAALSLAITGVYLLAKHFGLLDTAQDAATDSAKKHAAAQGEVTDAVDKGNKVLDDRAAALQKLTAFEQQLIAQSEARKKAEGVNTKEAELRRQAEIQEIDNELAEERRRLAANKEFDDAYPNRTTRLGGMAPIPSVDVQANEGRIRDLQRRRDELTGEAAKQAAAQGKIDAEAKERVDRIQGDAARQIQELERQRQQQAESQAHSILSQYESFNRPSRGGFGGRLAEQIGGTTRAQATEERTLKAIDKTNDLLERIKDAILQGKPILIGAK